MEKSIDQRVKEILTSRERTRDDKTLLFAIMLFEKTKVKSIDWFYDVLIACPDLESIRKAYNRVQNEYPELRGDTY